MKTPPQKVVNWLDNLVEFYDFVWTCGVSAHGACINSEMISDFASGGNSFEVMKKLILTKFPTEKSARVAFATPPVKSKRK